MRNISIFYTRDIQSTTLEKNQLFSSATNNHLEISINFAITITPAYKNIPPIKIFLRCFHITRKAEQRKQFDSRRAVTVDRIPLLFPRFLLFSSLLKIILSATTGKANWESEAEPSSGGQICSGSLFHSDTNFSNNVITRRTGQISCACKFLHVRLNYLSRSVASPFSRDANVE